MKEYDWKQKKVTYFDSLKQRIEDNLCITFKKFPTK